MFEPNDQPKKNDKSNTLYNDTISIISAQVQRKDMTPQEIKEMILEIYPTLQKLKDLESNESASVIDISNSNIEAGEVLSLEENPFLKKHKSGIKSIKAAYVVCLECGHQGVRLSSKHIESHGLTVPQYKEKYNIPDKQVLQAKNTSQASRERILENKMWEKRGANKAEGADTVKAVKAVKVTAKNTPKIKEKAAEQEVIS